MVSLTALWIPILVSAIVVFVASSIIHMVLPYHKKNFRKLANESEVLKAMRDHGVSPGDYMFPFSDDPKEVNSPEMKEKFNLGPVGIMTVLPNGTWRMGKSLVQWFVYSLVVGLFAGYLASRTVGPGSDYLAVFRIVGASAFMGYSLAHLHESIWKGQAWSTTFKFVFDGLVYALLTAGVFGWLWP